MCVLMSDELVEAVNKVQSTLLVSSEEVVSVAVEARQRCPTIKASLLGLFSELCHS